jgi:hypothetical protein
LGCPVIRLILRAPINISKYLIRGFVEIDQEGVPERDWLLFRLYAVLVGIGQYALRVLPWGVAIGILRLADTEGRSLAVVKWLIAYVPWVPWQENGGPPIHAVQITALGFFLAFVLALRLPCWFAGKVYVMLLDQFFANKVIGEERTKVVLDYVQQMAVTRGLLPALLRFFNAFATKGDQAHSDWRPS